MTPSTSASACTIAHLLTDGKVEYLDYDFRARAARRRGQPFNLAVAEKNLLILKSILEQHGVTLWLVFGTCLGAVRDGGFIPHDTDTDVAVFAHEKEKVLAAIPDLMKAGLMPIRTKRPDDLLTFMRNDEYIDIGFFGKFRDAEGFDYWCYQNNRVYGDHFEKFEKITFLGQTFLVPQKVETYLTSLYGAGWKTPVKNLPAKEPMSHLEFRPFSNLLVLPEFFCDLPAYAVLKLSENFPSYHDYSDIDILCADRAAVLAQLRSVGEAYERRGFKMKEESHEGHLHLDFYAPGATRLNFRFDLLESLDAYRKLRVAADFAPAILAGRMPTTRNGAEVYVPAQPHDLALRFLEYVDWKDERPDKIKHWHYIEKVGDFSFVDVVNRFTDLRINLTRENGQVQLSWARRPQASARPATPADKADEAQRVALVQQAAEEFAAQRYAEAAEQYCAALTLDPDATPVLMALGECLVELQDATSAHACFARLAALEPANEIALRTRDQLATIIGQAPAAGGKLLEDLLNSTLGFCNDCLNRQDFGAAMQALGRAVKLAPRDTMVRVHRGRLALFLNEAERAAQDFADALELDPGCAAAHGGLARLLLHLNKAAEAEQAADRALGIDASEDEALQVKAECAAPRFAPKSGATSEYYRAPAGCPLPEIGALYETLFSRRANGTFIACGPGVSVADGLTQALADVQWKGLRIDLDALAASEENSTALRQALRARQVEPGYEVLTVTLGGEACDLLATSELSHWRPQVVVVDRTNAKTEAYSTAYFREHQYLPVHEAGGVSVYVAREKLVARRARMDCFLIWGHGMPQWEDILGRIRARSVLEIIAIHRRPTGDMTKFVQDLYACDTVPFEHLRVKTRYLLTTPPEVIFILVRNHNTQEKIYGEGAFRHIQCALIKDVKEEVRNAWNPRVGGKRSEDHVIHATDYDSQVVHTLKVLGLPALEAYLRQPHSDYDLPYHLGTAGYREVEIPLDRVRARILGRGVVPIEQTPHYRFVAGERAPYQDYYARHAGKELNDDHTAGAFDCLIKTFDYGRSGRNGKPGLLVVLRQGEHYLLLDGVHRAAILKHQGSSTVRVLETLPIAGALRAVPPVATPMAPVVVRLMGGLGNQMFQYAAGLALARKNGGPLQLDLTFLQDRTPRANITPRSYALDIFPLHAGCELLTSADAMPPGLKPVAEKHFHHEPAFAELGGGVHLKGYWQSPRYFAEVDAEIRKNFALAPKLSAEASAVAAEIAATESVCLHVRRGDMVHNAQAAAVHGSCPAEYYRAACDVIAKKSPGARFFIFSDDPRWCESQDLTRGRAQTIVSRTGDVDSPTNDLFLMRQCRHFVIANSSFSWWAAYLGEHPQKRVIFPDPWFLEPSTDTSDLFPKEWIRWSRRPGPALKSPAAAPLVSIIMPCFKQAHFLQEAVESVVAQTLADWELIVVNDGSPDNTSQVTQDLIERHPERRIRLLEKANGGLASARNAGIAIAVGRFILPLDSDDRLHPQMLEKTVRLLERHPQLAIAYVDQLHFSAERQQVRVIEYDFAMLKHANFLAYCSLYRKEVWTKNGGYKTDVPGYEDWDFWITAGENGLMGKRVPELLFHYRRRTGSMLTAAKSLEHELRSQIVLHHPELYSQQEKEWAAKIGGTKHGTVGKIMGNGTDGDSVVETQEARPDGLRGKRVLIYTDDPGQGGAAHYNHSLLLALIETGAVAFCAQPKGDGKLTAEQAARGIQHCWTAYNPVVEFGRSFVDEDDARRIFAETQPDLVYFSDCCALSHVAAKKVAIDSHLPFAVICHSEAKYLAERFAQFLPTVKVQLAQAQAVIGVSKSSLGVLRDYFGLASDKGQVIYNGCAENYFAAVEPAVREKLRAEMKLPPDAVLCFTAARLDAGKCHRIQLEAIRRLRDSGRLGALHFAWAGDGDLRASLEEKVKALKLHDRVHLLGYRWDVRDLMGAADVFVLTTLYEAMPLCVLEAMARGLPVMASAVGGIPEELGETGILLPDPNVDVQKTIATLMESLVSLADSTHRRQSLGAGAKARARALFSGAGMTRATLGVMAEALSSQAAATKPEEFFGAEEVRTIEQLCTAYSEKPADAEIAAQLNSLRQGLMNFLVTAPCDQLEALFKGTFGQVFRALIKSGLPSEPPTEETTAQLAVLDEEIAAAPDTPRFDCRLLLARMLCAPGHRGLRLIVPEKIPAWFFEDYLAHVLYAPPVFVLTGEAEQYHDHLLGWARTIHERIRRASGEKLTLSIALFFATKVSYIPLYFSNRNTRELAEKRAAIMEFVLAKNGAAIDAKWGRRPARRAKIKVGFLNAHFSAQTETHVALPTLQLDRSRFEICLFVLATRSDPIEAHARSFADSFTVLPQNLHEQVKAIRAAALDVIIIGTNVTAVTNPVSLLALHRLARLQLVNFCSPVSTGMRHVDGYLTGTLNDVAGLQEHFSEKLYFCEGAPGCFDYTVEAKASSTFDRARLGLAPDDVVFVNAGACFKILPEMQETWAKILRAVPRSRLLLLPFNPNWSSAFPVKQFKETLTEACARHGVGTDRLVLADSLPSRADVKALEAIADVYLDTFPFSGSISVIDPLELGIPVMVWEGNTHRSRMAAALLRALGVPELITQDEAAYIALSVRLATDADYRRQLSERIRAGIAARPKFLNPAAYAADLGGLLESLVLPKSNSPRRSFAPNSELQLLSA